MYNIAIVPPPYVNKNMSIDYSSAANEQNFLDKSQNSNSQSQVIFSSSRRSVPIDQFVENQQEMDRQSKVQGYELDRIQELDSAETRESQNERSFENGKVQNTSLIQPVDFTSKDFQKINPVCSEDNKNIVLISQNKSNIIDSIKLKCYQLLNNQKQQGKRKISEFLHQNDRTYQNEQDHDTNKKNDENQDSTNQVKVEDLSRLRKLIKTNEPLLTNNKNQQDNNSLQSSLNKQLHFKKNTDIQNNNKQMLPESVSSLDQSSSFASLSSFSSNEIDQKNYNEQDSEYETDENEDVDTMLKNIYSDIQKNTSSKTTNNNQKAKSKKLPIEQSQKKTIQQKQVNSSIAHGHQNAQKIKNEDNKSISQDSSCSSLDDEDESMKCNEESMSDSVQQQESSDDEDCYIIDCDELNDIGTPQKQCFDSYQYANDYILILDLDNTLVHSSMGGLSYSTIYDPTVNIIETHVNEQKLYIKRRPFLKEFFEVAFKNFRVVMYTLGSLAYAKAVHKIFKKEYPEIFKQHKFLRIIAQNAQRPSIQSPSTTQPTNMISSPQVSEMKSTKATSEIPQQKDQKQQIQQNSKISSQSSSQNQQAQGYLSQLQSTQTYSQYQQNQNQMQNQQNGNINQQNNCQNPQTQNIINNTKYLKNISKYFPPEQFSKRLLIFDDNMKVYQDLWQKNGVFTKPYHHWNTCNPIQSSSDSFLFFSAQLLKQIIRTLNIQNIDLPLIYQDFKKCLLANDTFFIPIDDPEKQNLEELIKELGGTIIDNISLPKQPVNYQESQVKSNQKNQMDEKIHVYNHQQQHNINNQKQKGNQIPNYIIISNNQQQKDPLFKKYVSQNNIKLITSDWIKYCFLLNYKVSSDIFDIRVYQQLKSVQNIETDLANYYVQQSPI